MQLKFDTNFILLILIYFILPHIDKTYAKVGAPPKPDDLPEDKVPGKLNFNIWLEPLIRIVHSANISPL